MLRVGTIFMCVFKLWQVAQIFQKKKVAHQFGLVDFGVGKWLKGHGT